MTRVKGYATIFTIALLLCFVQPQKLSIGNILGSQNVTAARKEQSRHADVKASDQHPASDIYHQVALLSHTITMLKLQNDDLTRRVATLETCECRPVNCWHDNELHSNGDWWKTEDCKICFCQDGAVRCQQDTEDPKCQNPCGCEHGGVCTETGDKCYCPVGYYGDHCEEVCSNPCMLRMDPGKIRCHQEAEERFYYDVEEQQCKPFVYSGCGGTANNFVSSELCEQRCRTGACCFRTMIPGVERGFSGHGHYPMSIQCAEMTLGECQMLHTPGNNSVERGLEVISFKAGLACAEAGCHQDSRKCNVGSTEYHPGDIISDKCHTCTCHQQGYISCRCEKISERKELRDLTPTELARFQYALAQLKLTGGKGNAWDEIQDIYLNHIMHAQDAMSFLVWHRLLLRHVEYKLQQVDCDVSIPYFDFTTDSGTFQEAILWQANHFGGNGNPLGDYCVGDLPFGPLESWQPCVRRKFNTSVPIPSILELSFAISSPDYREMAMCLQSLIGHVHMFIGGHMETAVSIYDPVFLPLYAFVDKIFWQWQQKHGTYILQTLPQTFLHKPLLPFNQAPADAWHSQADLCVTYIHAGQGHPCNMSLVVVDDTVLAKVKPFMHGYGEDGFDSIGYAIDGYNLLGYDRDGYDRQGYNAEGYDRYGYDKTGYTKYGIDREGLDHHGNLYSGNIYDDHEMDCFCRNRKGVDEYGYDQYGFTTHGYDKNHCNYGSRGPFAPGQAARIWGIMVQQEKRFLMTLPRTCPPMVSISVKWSRQTWIQRPKDVTGLITITTPTESPPKTTTRLCFDPTSYLTSCPCEGKQQCSTNPCEGATCLAHPNAVCYMEMCGDCESFWYLDGATVDCQLPPKLPCELEPCERGGTCSASLWPNQPELIMCQCPTGYNGPHCQYPVLHACSQPIIQDWCPGNLEPKWHFDSHMKECIPYYQGCEGGHNHFSTRRHCKAACVIGACCYRRPHHIGRQYGYNLQGYDRYGFSTDGVNSNGVRWTQETALPSGDQIYDSNGFNWQGYDIHGYDGAGRDISGYDQDGYNQDGFNITGYSRYGEFDGNLAYGKQGYDKQGYNRAGFNCHGYNQDGLDLFGAVTGFTYTCIRSTWSECIDLEDFGINKVEVINFAPGKRCDEVNCHEQCGCPYNKDLFKFGEDFTKGCQKCKCNPKGHIDMECKTLRRRKEIRDMSVTEWGKFHGAVRKLAVIPPYPSKWHESTEIHSLYAPRAHRSAAFLPWHRNFLHTIENNLREVDCDVTIPYFDWTLDAGSLQTSEAWQANTFGGNGESPDQCVRYHPFKDMYPYYWTPCLRRQFNTSIQLPDAVDIEIILREADFIIFQKHLKAASALFHVWVGGHMASVFSAYDPVFLAHHAFIDKLWWDWQRRHPSGMLQYPSQSRYVPMPPSKTTPDDVFSSENQLCVTYVSLSEGATCHQYDASTSIDDPEVEYNNLGYEVRGYHQSGFDSIGFDFHGFYNDSFNRDGIDRNGFDRYGYDRHGFNTKGKTPFGLPKRNSNQPFDTASENRIFDQYGYNHFGVNKYGYDQNRFDVFGFDKAGVDIRGCDYYYKGPFYVLHKVWLDQQLSQISDDDLRAIPKLCNKVSSVPAWWYVVMSSTPAEPSIDYLWNHRPISPQGSRTPRPPASHNMWMPSTPDIRMCVALNRYTGCSVGQNVASIPCTEDLCHSSDCATHPGAVCFTLGCGGHCKPIWMDGRTRRTLPCPSTDECYHGGATYGNGDYVPDYDQCQTCRCHLGNVVCVKVTCPEVPSNCLQIVVPPGECCQQCLDICELNNHRYQHGEAIPSDLCEQCTCHHGNIECQPIICKVNCEFPVSLPEECCPSCNNGCLFQGVTYREGEPLPGADPCDICHCNHGNMTCSAVPCPDSPGDCVNDLTEFCCPLCQNTQCIYNGNTYKDGATVAEARSDHCHHCVCSRGEVSCRHVECEPVGQCRSIMMLEGECCAMCADCGQWANGATWNEGPCIQCECINGKKQCVTKKCDVLWCSHPWTPPGECCQQCNGCEFDGRAFQHGQEWQQDECQRCRCLRGNVQCDTTSCPPVSCHQPITEPGECCPKCLGDCYYGDKHYSNGTVFGLDTHPCAECTCISGDVRCGRVTCDTWDLPCSTPVTRPGDCCPSICPECTQDGVTYKHGSEWEVGCEKCFCLEGSVSCKPAHRCRHTCRDGIPDHTGCCMECTDCQREGRVYSNGATFSVVRGPTEACEECVCQGGNIQCRQVADCPQLPCTGDTTPHDKCCPVCKECSHDGVTYQHGAEWKTRCEECHCLEGSVSCKPAHRCRHTCRDGIPDHTGCCMECTDCQREGRVYSNGATFSVVRGPTEACEECVCQGGNIQCRQVANCPQLPCTGHTTPHDKCCPVCKECSHDGVTYQHGAEWKTRCEECHCLEGSVSCKPAHRCRHTCRDGIPDHTGCCMECTDCQREGRVYSNGATFSVVRGPTEACEECVCQGGNIQCRQVADCPQLPCTGHTTPHDKCCPVCKECSHDGVTYQHGAEWKTRCEECHCLEGSVSCKPAHRCRHTCRDGIPDHTGCCMKCSDCQREGRVYSNGATFSVVRGPTEACEECVCQGGNIQCRQVADCPQLPCTGHTTPHDKCCPVCKECSHDGVTYQHGAEWKTRCEECHCLEGSVSCKPAHRCRHTCRDGIPDHTGCCMECTDCQREGRVYSNGVTFLVVRGPTEACEECVCQGGNIQCRQVADCPQLPCTGHTTPHDKCCPVCKECSHDGVTYQHGAEWKTRCEECHCLEGSVSCKPAHRCRHTCRDGIPDHTGCCMKCSDCQREGRVYSNGATFSVVRGPTEACEECVCQGGNIQCRQVADCPQLPCTGHTTPHDKCCPVCKECSHDGVTYQHGAEWKTRCEECHCLEGSVSCKPAHRCRHTCRDGIPDHTGCCMECTDCQREGRVYSNGVTFLVVRGPTEACEECVCQGGNIQCRQVADCPQLPCTGHTTPHDKCCPVCKECSHDGVTYQHGAEWKTRCEECHCLEGSVSCKPAHRCRHTCRDGIPDHTGCCMECTDCQREGTVYSNGATFSVVQGPTEACEECVCQGGNIQCRQVADCPQLLCSVHTTPHDKCCPVCKGCSYQDATYADGDRVANRDPCQDCVCRNGEIQCERKPCPDARCAKPVSIPGQCCPLCTTCTYQGRTYPSGTAFIAPRNPCLNCSCLDGAVDCERLDLSCSVTCPHPTRTYGRCCPVCDGCQYQRRAYTNGQKFVLNSQGGAVRCQSCTCKSGHVTCEDYKCAPVSCAQPEVPDGECCPRCSEGCQVDQSIYPYGAQWLDPADPCAICTCQSGGAVSCNVKSCQDCQYARTLYRHGQRFPHPTDHCQNCICRAGAVECEAEPCPPVSCQSPRQVAGQCCPVCDPEGCQYEGEQYAEDQIFKPPGRPCDTCRCIDRQVVCQQPSCASVTCSHPIISDCCPVCSGDCLYEGVVYKDQTEFQDPRSRCQWCHCAEGSVQCSEKPCPDLHCLHPATPPGTCCPKCQDCVYGGEVYRDKQKFASSQTACTECECQSGTVRCYDFQCPPAPCAYPVTISRQQAQIGHRDQCCPSCDGCSYGGLQLPNGGQTINLDDPCETCVCYHGNMTCHTTPCAPVYCQHPASGRCCPECNDCLFDENIRYHNGRAFTNPANPCQICQCTNGNVQCETQVCPEVRCQTPLQGECCLECPPGCDLEGQQLEEGDTAKHPNNPCLNCLCKNGNTICEAEDCPEVGCDRPVQGECCPVCPPGCDFYGQQLTEGESARHPHDSCQTCQCKNFELECERSPCAAVRCTHPSQDKCGCPTCVTCIYRGQEISDSQTFTPQDDQCSTCTCQTGTVSCRKTECPSLSLCLTPIIPAGECCPVCNDCLFEEEYYLEGENFPNPRSPCEICTCKEGQVHCEQKVCVTKCSHPTSGRCCPLCDGCMYQGREYRNTQQFNPTPCEQCTCQSGSVSCTQIVCPDLPCENQITEPGHCCPRCAGCQYEGVRYEEGASWGMSADSCVMCHCRHGVSVCSEMQCISPCPAPVTVPGLCCPVCPGCEFNSVQYNQGDSFSPTGDPCDVCTCKKGYLECHRKQCMSQLLCAPEGVVDPSPNMCCPACLQVLTTCKVEEMGLIVRPNNDPCFTCECRSESLFVCSHKHCPRLDCALAEQVKHQFECCPKCTVCTMADLGVTLQDGDVWTDPRDSCHVCTCQVGSLSCEHMRCRHLVCESGSVVQHVRGDCCPKCVSALELKCQYGGKQYQNGDSWEVDECTQCHCDKGKVECHSERCAPINCASDHTPTLLPAQCCPVCQPEPATCIGFGDPHYQTFDGQLIHFQGTCTYTMAADCNHGHFSIEAEHDDRGTGGAVSWVKTLTLRMPKHNITAKLLPKTQVLVNDVTVSLPYLYDTILYVEQKKSSILLNTNIGVKIVWSGDGYVEVSVAGTYLRALCGLCGNFNHYPEDDLTTRQGTIVTSTATFGDSWKVDSMNCSAASDIDPCTTAGYRIRRVANTKCAVMKSEAFEACHRVVPPEPFYASCVYDMCVCGEDEACLCDILSSYALECAKAGVILNWRSASMCAVGCPEDRGFIFDECGPACPRTCENRDLLPGQLSKQCIKPCIPGCQCPAHLVLYEDRCIRSRDCPIKVRKSKRKQKNS